MPVKDIGGAGGGGAQLPIELSDVNGLVGLLASDDVNYDTLQELVDALKANTTALGSKQAANARLTELANLTLADGEVVGYNGTNLVAATAGGGGAWDEAHFLSARHYPTGAYEPVLSSSVLGPGVYKYFIDALPYKSSGGYSYVEVELENISGFMSIAGRFLHMDGTIIQNTSSISGPSFGGDDEVITLGSGSFDNFYDILTINGMIKVDVASSGRLHLKARNADASTFYFNEATALYLKRVGDAT